MVIQMLEAVSEMLNNCGGLPEEQFRTRVMCANTVLLKVIKGMQSNLENQITDIVKVPYKEERKKTPNNAPPVTISPPNQDQYPIILNDDKTIKEIQGLPFDALVELDGVTMTHKDAIGMTFNTGRIL